METATGRGPSERAPSGAPALAVEWLGSVAYERALALQKERVAGRRAGSCGDALLLLEHPPVVTLGRSTKPESLLDSPEGLRARGLEVHEVARGGDVTWHGPGQLVGYLVLDLDARGERDVHRHLRRIETILIDALAALGVAGERREGMTGVFVAGSGREGSDRPRKIASIGVGLRGWVTYHGFALNVELGPEAFAGIVPCGLHGVEMTSVAAERGSSPESAEALAKRVRAEVGRAAKRLLAAGAPIG